MASVVIEVRGGVVVEVYSDDPNLRPVIIDWDDIHASAESDRAATAWDCCAALTELPDDTRAFFEETAGPGEVCVPLVIKS